MMYLYPFLLSDFSSKKKYSYFNFFTFYGFDQFFQSYGTLEEGNIVLWDNNGKSVRDETLDIDTEVAFFYGLPEMGRNLVWKGITTDPSLSLSYYQKVKSFLKPVQAVLRSVIFFITIEIIKSGKLLRTTLPETQKYGISTLSSPVEVLRIIGQTALQDVFVNTELLSLRNVRGEGCSLTHDEWKFVTEELEYFPQELTEFLFDPVSG